MIICILQKGTMGTLSYLNSQEEQIISDHVFHTDHSELKAEQTPRALRGTLPGVSAAPPRPWRCSAFSTAPKFDYFSPITGVLGGAPCGQTNRQTVGHCSLRKPHHTRAQRPQFLICTASSSQIWIFGYDLNISFP